MIPTGRDGDERVACCHSEPAAGRDSGDGRLGISATFTLAPARRGLSFPVEMLIGGGGGGGATEAKLPPGPWPCMIVC